MRCRCTLYTVRPIFVTIYLNCKLRSGFATLSSHACTTVDAPRQFASPKNRPAQSLLSSNRTSRFLLVPSTNEHAKTLSYQQIPENIGTFNALRGVVQEVADDAGARGSQMNMDPVDKSTVGLELPAASANMLHDTSSMDDLLGLNNLVANTAYLKAQHLDRSELRKHMLSLTLPRPKSYALHAAADSRYESLCEQQPIGRMLFQQFLQTCNPQYEVTAKFLEELSIWSFAEDETKEKAKLSILAKFCQPESRHFLSFLTGENAKRCKELSCENFDETMTDQLKEASRDFLKGQPFCEYLNSPFFYKFLQWKEYEKQKISDKNFYEFRTLGKGGFGEVLAVQVKLTGQMYACKKLDKRHLKKKGGNGLALVEKQILEKVNSLFIVNLAYAYANRTHLCLVMDLMNGGDLRFHIYELGERGIRMERVVYYVAQITIGILHLHSMDIVYRDMKPENVLLDGKGQCRLSDLGLAVELPKGKTICQKAGTTGYMAPEVLKQEYYRTSVDWWALGCSIYEMVAARLPFRDFREKVQNTEVTRRTLEDDCKFEHKRFDAATKDIISHFLKRKVENRLGCRDSDPRNHVFFQNINFRRLEAGLVDPPWVPKSNVVYTRDTDKFVDTSEVEDIDFDAKDETFFMAFSTGAVSIPWQKEMIESGVFDQLNDLGLNGHNCGRMWTSRMCVIC